MIGGRRNDMPRRVGIPSSHACEQSAWCSRRSCAPANGLPSQSYNQQEYRRCGNRIRQPGDRRARLERRQIGRQRVGACIPIVRPWIDRALDDPGELRRQIRSASRRSDRDAFVALVGEAEIAHGLRADRVRAGHQVIEKDTQTVDVTLDGGVAPG